LEKINQNIVFVLADMVENRDSFTGGHIERTAILVKLLIEGMKERGIYGDEIAEWDSKSMANSSLLHDIGKISISDLILNKNIKLTSEEFERMKSHCLEGQRIIDKVIARTGENSFLRNAKLFALYHHERFSGGGYPFNLSGEDIPLQGRIMAIVDVYDALISKRSYKEPFTVESALNIITSETGEHFDPKIVAVFIELIDEFNKGVVDIN
ncbi:MAG: HD domain-containing protein, partial [Defluviitaleaceae bacterium]|nr:HD domain-containing protein [Defluviitaleaceae bacterium]